MRVFHNNPDSYSEKVNFVDDNNVLVGFDFAQDCYESFGYYLTKEIPQRPEPKEKRDYDWGDGYTPDNLPDTAAEGFQFDPTFFRQLTNNELYTEEGGAVVFRLVKGDEQLFLTLYNSHNGYYSHGFHMDVGGESIQQGSL